MANIFEESRKDVKIGQRALLVIFVSEDVGQMNAHESDCAKVPGDFSDVSRFSLGHKQVIRAKDSKHFSEEGNYFIFWKEFCVAASRILDSS